MPDKISCGQVYVYIHIYIFIYLYQHLLWGELPYRQKVVHRFSTRASILHAMLLCMG